MSLQAETSSSRTLRARLSRAGLHGVSASQIERWQKAGLLPPPRKRGRGRGAGTVSSYPPGTVPQVRALLRFLGRHRNLEKVVVLLKLNGYVVSTRACRRAIEHLVLDRVDEIDPYGHRRYEPPEKVAAKAAERVARKRPRSVEEAQRRKDDISSARGRASFLTLLGSSLTPVLGGTNVAVLRPVVEHLGLTELAFSLGAATPGLSQAVAEEIAAGHLSFDWIREDALPRLTDNDLNTLVRLLRVLLAFVERSGMQFTPIDAFVSDCAHALRYPDRPLPSPPPERGAESEVEAEALAFFASVRPRRKTTNSIT